MRHPQPINCALICSATATFEGQDVVRICVTNGETKMQDVSELIAVLNERP